VDDSPKRVPFGLSFLQPLAEEPCSLWDHKDRENVATCR
jgi:hypothetical protein